MSKVKAKVADKESVQISIEATMEVWEWELVLKAMHAPNNPSFQLIHAIRSTIAKLKHEAFEEFNATSGE